MKILLAIFLSLASWNAVAQTPTPGPDVSAPPIPAPPQLGATSYLLMDFNSGRVLVEQNPDMRVEPASITKLMTAYVVFHGLAEGKIRLEDPVNVSEKAWRTGGSRMFI